MTLTASPANEWQVSGWFGTDSDGITDKSNTVTMPAQNHSAGVTYRETPPDEGVGDEFEADNDCANYRDIPVTGALQFHSFHREADEDWVRFQARSGHTYLIQVDVPNTSPADVALELYPRCGSLQEKNQDFTFSPGVRMSFEAVEDGPIYARLLNHDAGVAGDHVQYTVSVRSLNDSVKPGALIVVAGAIRANDPVQDNIYHVTDAVYKLFINKGYTDEQIYYLSPDIGRDHVDARADRAGLQTAITEWAKDNVGADRALTIYMMDHGARDRFYLDKQRNQSVSPADLDAWLTEIEEAHPGLRINVIIDACYSGSFITGDKTLVGENRVIITSTDADNLAWASRDGAIFSDHFLEALGRNESLYNAYREAQVAAKIAHPHQKPFVNGDSNTRPGQADDGAQAATRGFSFAGTLDDFNWPPHIFSVTPPEIIDGRGVIRADVRDDEQVNRVWAVIYPPDYVAPIEGEALVQDEDFSLISTIVLLDNGKNSFSATFRDFRQSGTYRVVVYAEDEFDVGARPVSFEVQVDVEDEPSQTFYLPMMRR
ncbi:hypothetical protein KFU94_37810 [Chloroflexi bacterium TSY]|nr:hypothetical protein [Chloroflexi bacterium TSY]